MAKRARNLHQQLVAQQQASQQQEPEIDQLSEDQQLQTQPHHEQPQQPQQEPESLEVNSSSYHHNQNDNSFNLPDSIQHANLNIPVIGVNSSENLFSSSNELELSNLTNRQIHQLPLAGPSGTNSHNNANNLNVINGIAGLIGNLANEFVVEEEEDEILLDSTGAKKRRKKTPKVTAPRTSRACLNCRKQKMRCEGAEDPPCKRCRNSESACVFERRNIKHKPILPNQNVPYIHPPLPTLNDAHQILSPQDAAWQTKIEQQLAHLTTTLNSFANSLVSQGLIQFDDQSGLPVASGSGSNHNNNGGGVGPIDLGQHQLLSSQAQLQIQNNHAQEVQRQALMAALHKSTATGDENNLQSLSLAIDNTNAKIEHGDMDVNVGASSSSL